MPKELQPLGNFVVVEPLATDEKLGEGLIVRPEQYKQPSGQARVLAVGPGRPDVHGNMVPVGVAVGDIVVYNWINGRELNLEGRTLRLLDSAEIIGKFKFYETDASKSGQQKSEANAQNDGGRTKQGHEVRGVASAKLQVPGLQTSPDAQQTQH
jgi:chaperonin GroES